MPKYRPSSFAIGLLLLGLCSTPLFLRVPNHLERPILYELHDACHSGLFLVVTLALAFWLNSRLKPAKGLSIKILLIASLTSLFIGGAIEVLQMFIKGRDASWGDVGRDAIGVACAIFIYLTAMQKGRKVIQLIYAVAALCVIAIALAPAYPWIEAQKIRDKALPILMNFETHQTLPYVTATDGAQLYIETAPKQWTNNHSAVAKVLIPKKHSWPGIMLKSPYPNWSSFQWLSFEVFSPLKHSSNIVVVYYNAEHIDRAVIRQSHTLKPGLNVIRQQLKGDDQEVTKVIIHSVNIKDDIELFFDNFRLE